MVSPAFYVFGGGGLTAQGGTHCFCLQAADLPSDQFLDIDSKLGPSSLAFYTSRQALSLLSNPTPPAARAIFWNKNQTTSVPSLKPFSGSPGALRTKPKLHTAAFEAWPGLASLTLPHQRLKKGS